MEKHIHIFLNTAICDNFFKHKNLFIKGYVKHEEVLKILNKVSISVVCSRWEEPFGRTSLEAASRGCAVIISNRGGLPETITNAITLNKLTYDNVYKSIEKLISSNKEELIQTDEIGERISDSLIEFFSIPQNIELINSLKAVGLQFESNKKETIDYIEKHIGSYGKEAEVWVDQHLCQYKEPISVKTYKFNF